MTNEQIEAAARATFLGMYNGEDAGWSMVDARIKAQWHTIARAALEAAERAAWQPIKTAPKDGRPLLLNPTFVGMFDVAMGYWQHEHDCWYMVNVGHMNGLWHPTRWRPLPEPPQ